MFLGGLWHGAAWSYAVWGTTHGLFLALERLSSKKLRAATSFMGHRTQDLLGWAIVFSVVSLAWLLFKLPHFSQAVEYSKSIFLNGDLPVKKQQILLIAVYSLPVVLLHLSAIRFRDFGKWSALVYALMLFLIVTNRGGAGEFIYFQF